LIQWVLLFLSAAACHGLHIGFLWLVYCFFIASQGFMGQPKVSLVSSTNAPNFEVPQSIFDLLNFVMFELQGVSGSVITRICEQDYGITREEWQFLAMLAKLGEMSPSDLANHTTVDRSQTSRTLRGLLSKKLVQRLAVPSDARKARVLLTPEGRALYAKVLPQVVQMHHYVLQDLDGAERSTLARHLQKMQARALEAARLHKPEGTTSRRQGGSRTTWDSQQQTQVLRQAH
jgi:DNA-binding MarR family transcriptional regulator